MTSEKKEEATLTTRSPGQNKEDWHIRAVWDPSPSEFQAYLDREVAMAKVALLRWSSICVSESGKSAPLGLHGVTEFTSLFSTMTVERALRSLKERTDFVSQV